MEKKVWTRDLFFAHVDKALEVGEARAKRLGACVYVVVVVEEAGKRGCVLSVGRWLNCRDRATVPLDEVCAEAYAAAKTFSAMASGEDTPVSELRLGDPEHEGGVAYEEERVWAGASGSSETNDWDIAYEVAQYLALIINPDEE